MITHFFSHSIFQTCTVSPYGSPKWITNFFYMLRPVPAGTSTQNGIKPLFYDVHFIKIIISVTSTQGIDSRLFYDVKSMFINISTCREMNTWVLPVPYCYFLFYYSHSRLRTGKKFIEFSFLLYITSFY